MKTELLSKQPEPPIYTGTMINKNAANSERGKQVFVSVIMNCYNGARYLSEALGSVLAQTFSDWEIIFWDNQSSDESAVIFNSYLDSRFRYFRAPEHTTLGQARNLAVGHAYGEWIAFLDCDDLWLPGKLEKQVAIINEEGPDLGLVYGRSQTLVEEVGIGSIFRKRVLAYEEDRIRVQLPEGSIFPYLLRENFVPLLSSVVRRSAYWADGGIDPAYKQAEDYDLFVKISKTYKIRAVQDIVCSYRIHGSNISYTQGEDGYQETIEIISRYLPAPPAKKGIRRYQTSYAVYEMRNRRILKGVKRLLMHGDIIFFLMKSKIFIRRRLWWIYMLRKIR